MLVPHIFGRCRVARIIISTKALQSLRRASSSIAPREVWLPDPHDPQAIAEGIYRLLTDEQLRRDLRLKGLARARQFSWEESVRRVRAIYQEVAGG